LPDEVYQTGKPYSASGSRYAFKASPGEPATERYVDFVFQPITGSDGAVRGILVQGADVTSRAIADQALSLNRARLDYATRLSGIGFWYCDLPFDELEWDTRFKDHFFFGPNELRNPLAPIRAAAKVIASPNVEGRNDTAELRSDGV